MDDIKDRGLQKWASSFMLPEHVEMLKNMDNDYFKEKKPVLDEYQLQEIDEKLAAAIEYRMPVIIEMWHDGFFSDIEGSLNNVDNLNKLVWITERSGDSHKIKYECIVGIEFAD